MNFGGDAEDDPARAKAEFCLVLGIAPSEYDRLTDAEVRAFIAVHNERVDQDENEEPDP